MRTTFAKADLDFLAEGTAQAIIESQRVVRAEIKAACDALAARLDALERQMAIADRLAAIEARMDARARQ